VVLDVVIALGGEHEADRRTGRLAHPGQVTAAGLEFHTVVRGDEKGRIGRRGARFADQRLDALQVFLGLGGLGGPHLCIG